MSGSSSSSGGRLPTPLRSTGAAIIGLGPGLSVASSISSIKSVSSSSASSYPYPSNHSFAASASKLSDSNGKTKATLNSDGTETDKIVKQKTGYRSGNGNGNGNGNLNPNPNSNPNSNPYGCVFPSLTASESDSTAGLSPSLLTGTEYRQSKLDFPSSLDRIPRNPFCSSSSSSSSSSLSPFPSFPSSSVNDFHRRRHRPLHARLRLSPPRYRWRSRILCKPARLVYDLLYRPFIFPVLSHHFASWIIQRWWRRKNEKERRKRTERAKMEWMQEKSAFEKGKKIIFSNLRGDSSLGEWMSPYDRWLKMVSSIKTQPTRIAGGRAGSTPLASRYYFETGNYATLDPPSSSSSSSASALASASASASAARHSSIPHFSLRYQHYCATRIQRRFRYYRARRFNRYSKRSIFSIAATGIQRWWRQRRQRISTFTSTSTSTATATGTIRVTWRGELRGEERSNRVGVGVGMGGGVEGGGRGREISSFLVESTSFVSEFDDSFPSSRSHFPSELDRPARVIQRAYRRFSSRRIYFYYRSLLLSHPHSDPFLLLRALGVRSVDRSCGLYVRFRLAGGEWPPLLVYKIYTTQKVTDINAFAPRDYGRERKLRKKKDGKLDLLDDAESKKYWYRRWENNGWRPIHEPMQFLYSKSEKSLDSSFANNSFHASPHFLGAAGEEEKRKEFHPLRIVRQEEVRRRKKKKKLEWWRKMYAMGFIHFTNEEKDQHQQPTLNETHLDRQNETDYDPHPHPHPHPHRDPLPLTDPLTDPDSDPDPDPDPDPESEFAATKTTQLVDFLSLPMSSSSHLGRFSSVYDAQVTENGGVSFGRRKDTLTARGSRIHRASIEEDENEDEDWEAEVDEMLSWCDTLKIQVPASENSTSISSETGIESEMTGGSLRESQQSEIGIGIRSRNLRFDDYSTEWYTKATSRPADPNYRMYHLELAETVQTLDTQAEMDTHTQTQTQTHTTFIHTRTRRPTSYASYDEIASDGEHTDRSPSSSLSLPPHRNDSQPLSFTLPRSTQPQTHTLAHTPTMNLRPHASPVELEY